MSKVSSTASIAIPNRIEVKVGVAPVKAKKLEEALGWKKGRRTPREVVFLEAGSGTSNFESGVVVRGRLEKKVGDITLKLRPVAPAQVDPKWFSVEGFKAEPDLIGGVPVYSAQLTHDYAPADWTRRMGADAVKALLSPEQLALYAEFTPEGSTLQGLTAKDTIDTVYWKGPLGDLPKVTAERWKLPGGEKIVEFSAKVPLEEGARTETKLRRELEKLGFAVLEQPALKTRLALAGPAADV